jgi:hypothetical protein
MASRMKGFKKPTQEKKMGSRERQSRERLWQECLLGDTDRIKDGGGDS